MTKELANHLEQLREELEVLNTSFFETLRRRRETLNKIAQLKSDSDLTSWDPLREYKLFKKLLENQDNTDVLYFAQLLEIQAYGVMHDYPRWSEGEHLSKQSGSKWEKVNPILLMQLNKSEYNRLSLKKDIKQKISNLSL